jgi:spore coat polysaccharide biosynthesis protein SpsF
MKIVAIMQARMGSTRLPGKSLLPLAGKPMVHNIVERVQRARRLDAIVLAVPLRDAPAFAFLSGSCFLYAYAGEETDLVGRYLGAAQAFDADVIVRIPCDNPCIDPAYIDAAVERYLTEAHVYYSNTTARSGQTYVDGIGAEVCSLSRWQWLDRRTRGEVGWREHPHRYFVEQGLLALPTADLRLDVNTQDDYDFIARLYAHFTRNDFTTADVVAYMESKKVTA